MDCLKQMYTDPVGFQQMVLLEHPGVGVVGYGTGMAKEAWSYSP